MSASTLSGNPGQPVWNDQIEQLFAAPYWLAADQRGSVAAQWLGCMNQYGLTLNAYASVKQSAPLIYHYLHSREMPLTSDPEQYWPDAALEQFRAWVNQGCRLDAGEPLVPNEVLPPPSGQAVTLRVRKDIRALTDAELADYRMRLDDILQIWNADPRAPGQVFSAVHGDWCLHYQEAFLLWHRAYLMRFEQVIGCAVPYWNWMAEDAAIDGRLDAGLPQAFIDETYIHPVTGAQRPNPLRYAAARNGQSKACSGTKAAPPGTDCRWVQRDPLLYTKGDDQRAARSKKIAMTRIFQEQVAHALTWPNFSQPQGWPGYPWANIPEFNPPQPDSLYPNRTDFDGLYEQPHDNYHGWIGPDMGDNNYTAYDPVFWSYHANIDRIFEIWLRAHPAALYTANFPLHPFGGPGAQRFEFDDPRTFVYTTIGDLSKDSRALGFDFGPTVAPDFTLPAAHRLPGAGNADAQTEGLYVLFNGVRCTHDSYTIDVFLNQPDGAAPDASPDNPHYVGRFTRIGMGMEDDKGRCIKHGVTRVLDASANARALGIVPQAEARVTLLVADLASGELLSPAHYQDLPGFGAELAWGQAWPRAVAKKAGGCCPMKSKQL